MNRRSIPRWARGRTRSANSRSTATSNIERVKDWWGADLPVSRGNYNFDIVRYEFYRDRDVAFEGFTGKNYLFREEFTARIWATRYDFPAIKDGRVKRETVPDETPSGAQGWFINTRRDKFKDPRVREALIYAFDFEWTNKTIMYGAYARTHSPFQNSDMMAKRAAVAGRAEAARAVPRPGAGRSVRRALRAAGVGRFGAGPRRCCARRSNCCRTPASSSRTASGCCRTARCFAIEFLLRRALASAASRALYQESRHARHRGEPAPGRCRAVPRAGGGFRFRHDDRALLDVGDAGRLRCGRSSPRRPPRPRARTIWRASPDPAIDALIEKIIARRDPRRSDGRLPRLRPRVPRRALLGAAMVPQDPPARLLGHVRPPEEPAALSDRCIGRPASAISGGMTPPRPAKLEQAK